MRRTARPLTATALAVAFAALATTPAYGGEGTGRLELSPAGVVPGDEVTVGTAACGADGTAAGDASAVGSRRLLARARRRTAGTRRAVRGAAERTAWDVRDRRDLREQWPSGHR